MCSKAIVSEKKQLQMWFSQWPVSNQRNMLAMVCGSITNLKKSRDYPSESTCAYNAFTLIAHGILCSMKLLWIIFVFASVLVLVMPLLNTNTNNYLLEDFFTWDMKKKSRLIWLIALFIALKDVDLSLLNNFDKQDFTLKVFLLHNWDELREATNILTNICNVNHPTFFFLWSPAGEHGMSPV